jgi:hypothetical protein
MKKIALAIGAFLAVIGPVPSLAQNGAMWQDDRGRMMELNFLGGGPAAPLPKQTPPAEMASIFGKICVQTKGDFAAAAKAAAEMGFADKSSDAPTGKAQPSSRMLIATGDGVVVSQTSALLQYRQLQCNVVFYVPELSESVNLEAELATFFGRPADNESTRLKKNGKPNKSFHPTWTVVGLKSQALTVSAYVMRFNQFMGGNRVFFGMREATESK